MYRVKLWRVFARELFAIMLDWYARHPDFARYYRSRGGIWPITNALIPLEHRA